MGGLYWQLGYTVRAISPCRRSVALRPQREHSSLGLFHTLKDAGFGVHAIEEARRFLKQVDAGAECSERTGSLFRAYDRDGVQLAAEAHRHAKKAQDPDLVIPEHPILRNSWRDLDHRVKSQATTDLWLANSTVLTPRIIHSMSLGRKRMQEAAASSLEEGLRTHPEDTNAWLLLASIYRQLGDYIRAIEPCHRAAQLQPRDEVCSLALFHALLDVANANEGVVEARRFLQEIQAGAEASESTVAVYSDYDLWTDLG